MTIKRYVLSKWVTVHFESNSRSFIFCDLSSVYIILHGSGMFFMRIRSTTDKHINIRLGYFAEFQNDFWSWTRLDCFLRLCFFWRRGGQQAGHASFCEPRPRKKQNRNTIKQHNKTKTFYTRPNSKSFSRHKYPACKY